MTIILFVLVLLVTVIAHEWGHFIAARKCGMQVDEFGFGIPPRLWSWKKGETRYSVNALPIGGFVKIAGENGAEDGADAAPRHRQFDTKPWWQKSIVLVAGVVCNIILAIVLFTISFMIGVPTYAPDGVPTVISITPEYPAAVAGIMPSDLVTDVQIGSRSLPVFTTTELRRAINTTQSDVTISYTRGGISHTAVVAPKDTPQGRLIGLDIETVRTVQYPFFSAVQNAWHKTIDIVGEIFRVIGGLFTGTTARQNLAGPVGLARSVGVAATMGIAYLIAFTAAISVNLAVLNILPFPALDGGRLVIVLLEAIFRRRFSQTVVGIIHTVGFVILLGLMVILTVGDIRSLF